MKKLFVLTFAILFAGVFGMFAQTNGNDAYTEITSIQRIMLQASEYVMEAENNLELEIVHLQFDLIMGGDWKYVYRTLSKGWTYVAYAEGETAMVRDMDLRLMKQDPITEEWTEISIDTKEDFGGMCAVTVSETAQYAFGMKVATYESGFSGCHYFLFVAHAKPE
jgi:hypothetical protein